MHFAPFSPFFLQNYLQTRQGSDSPRPGWTDPWPQAVFLQVPSLPKAPPSPKDIAEPLHNSVPMKITVIKKKKISLRPPNLLWFPLSFFYFDSLMSHSFVLHFPFLSQRCFSLLLPIPHCKTPQPVDQKFDRDLQALLRMPPKRLHRDLTFARHHLLHSSGISPSGSLQQTPSPWLPLHLPCQQSCIVLGFSWAASATEKTGIFTFWGEGFKLVQVTLVISPGDSAGHRYATQLWPMRLRDICWGIFSFIMKERILQE